MALRYSLLAVVLAAALPCAAEGVARWVPEDCAGAESAASWNDAYRQGFVAIERGDAYAAQRRMCSALLAARVFDARDWRYAETLDELGRIAFDLGHYDRAERLQGAAIAEMLLAVGPHGEPLRDGETSAASPVREDCRSGLRVYTTRLGWIHERVPGRLTVEALARAPWRIFAAGYLPLDAGLAARLEWLIARYLLEENLAAAEELTELQRSIAPRQN